MTPMSTLEEKLARLRASNAAVRAGDAELDTESADIRPEVMLESMTGEDTADAAIEQESIIMRRTRPVLAIRDDEAVLEFAEAEDSAIWRARLEHARPQLVAAARAVGRIEIKGSELDWVGTGWLVADTILVTNRHVAQEFAVRRGDGFSFSVSIDGPIRAATDFKQEIDNPATAIFKLLRPLHIEARPGPDVAFFEIEAVSGDRRLAAPIALAAPRTTENAATIGYPAFDSRIPEPELMERIYGRIYNKKRLAPGAVTRVEAVRILHNCTTLGGNSGSVVLDLDSGAALGLHFSGSFLSTNHAVRADVVRTLLANVRAGRTRTQASRSEAAVVTPAATPAPGSTVSVTIPLTVTMSIGAPAVQASAQRPATALAPAPDYAGDGDDGDEGDEGVVADYAGRKGYVRDFLGIAVALPTVDRDAADVLPLTIEGRATIELPYQHFSVVMSRSRRMCFFSAVNIDGGLSRKDKRVAWKWDPRLPRAQQIMKECYGDPPRFSRGHMTRREDPGWGDAVTSKRGNNDSMHVTNATPQMQAFNAPIWLALEDHALDHAREDDMKISVFTGPYFAADDPTKFGVRIPVAFWKVIAFIHDDTGELCATGYEMTQRASLQPEGDDEFVFGSFHSAQLGIATQVPIASIELRAGLDLGGLAGFDPLANANEAVSLAPRSPLAVVEQIRFA
jgi:endonuclease G, mitochondrial